jgi:hypothetical protein
MAGKGWSLRLRVTKFRLDSANLRDSVHPNIFTKNNPMTTKPIPEGYHTVTPYLIVDGAQKLIDFLKQAFDAKETFCMRGAGEKVMHAEVVIGDSTIMIADLTPQWQARSSMIYLYVEDVDAVYKLRFRPALPRSRSLRTSFMEIGAQG